MLASSSILAAASGSGEPGKQESATSLSLDVREIHPGIPQGYLSQEEMPNSLLILPPPPDSGSSAWEFDIEMADYYLRMDEGRKTQATMDANLRFPEAVEAFNMVLDQDITEEDTPHLYMMLRRTLSDAGLSTYSAKNYYRRKRPFMVNHLPTCTPDDEEMLRKDGSYPSGHTAIGWTWALILTEVFPDQADEILARGKEFGISRAVCNVHWYSDIVAGRMMGAATLARLHANEIFRLDLQDVREEVKCLVNP